MRFSPRVGFIGIPFIASVVLLGLIIRANLFTRVAQQGSVETLARAAAELNYRPIKARLSGFAYRPEARGHDRPSAKLYAAISEVLKGGDPHAVGIAFLLTGDAGKAVDFLETAARAEPRNALLLSDLSAAYDTRARNSTFIPDFVAALDAAERSWRLRPTPEAGWNRAMATEALHAARAAERAWSDFLHIDAALSWRAEAEMHLAALRSTTESDEWRGIETQLPSRLDRDQVFIERAVHRLPAPALGYLEDILLPRWAKAHLNHERDEAGLRRMGRIIGRTLADDGDSFGLDTIQAIDDACINSSTACDQIARGIRRFAEGRDLMQRQAFAKASAAFVESSMTFDRLGSPYAFSARHRNSACLIHENRFDDAGQVAVGVIAKIGSRRYRTLLGRCLWHVGLIRLHEARPEESIAQYTTARQLFIEARDTADLAAIELLLADAYEYAGDRDVAMRHRVADLQAMQKSGDTSKLDLGLFEAGTSIASSGQLIAADYFLAESEHEAVDRRHFAIAALASMWRSTLSSRRAELTEASEQSRMAGVYWNRTTDPGQHALVGANVMQIAAASPRDMPPSEKVTETIRFFEQAGNRAWLPELLRQRALIHENEGNPGAAETDYRHAIDISEQTLDRAATATMRDGFATDVRANYEDMIRLLLRRRSSREALAFAERARLIGQQSSAGHDVLATIKALPRSMAAAVYEIQAGDVVVWLVTRDSVMLFKTSHANELEELTAASNSTFPPRALSRLYDLLMRDWISHLRPDADLVVIPPPELARVPFAALLNSDSGRSVVDDHSVTVAPNLASLMEPPVTLSASDAVLIVGDPSYRDLPILLRSRTEVERVAGRYSHPTVLRGAQATARNVSLYIGQATALHFSGHAVANDLVPEMSSLLLAPEDGVANSRIYVHELLQRRLPLKLVVLSACSTAKSRAGGARGSLTIGQAFLDGGARAVVGTLWPVSDEAAATFSVSLHAALARGDDVARATRFAQLHVRSIESGDSSWAAFYLLLGNAPNKEVRD